MPIISGLRGRREASGGKCAPLKIRMKKFGIVRPRTCGWHLVLVAATVSQSATASRLAAQPGYPGSVDGSWLPYIALRSMTCELNGRPLLWNADCKTPKACSREKRAVNRGVRMIRQTKWSDHFFHKSESSVAIVTLESDE